MAKAVYRDSPFLEFQYTHVNKPDAKFRPENPEYKVKARGPLSDPKVAALKQSLDEAAEACMEEFKASDEWSKVKPGDRAKFELYVPYELEYDDAGNETGYVIFEFKQNARIKLADGGYKEVKIAIYDAADKETTALVRFGAIGRVRYSIRPLAMKTLKKCGARLDFSAVQIKSMPQGGGRGFGAVEDGDFHDETGFGSAETTASGSPADGSADY